MMVASLALLLATVLAPDLKSIQREIDRSWGEGKPARALRTKCEIELDVDVEDEVFGDLYFPNSTLLPSGKTVHWSRWVEEIARKRDKQYEYFRFIPSGSAEPPPGLEAKSAFNGSGSWAYKHGIQRADVHSGDHPTTRLNLDYYGGMIGFPGKLLTPSRGVPGTSEETYQLDRLIPSGLYSLAGEETVDGEACVILERPGRDRVWLARDKGWAIARREWRWSDGGPLKRRIANRDFRPLTGGAWLPYSATMEIFGTPETRPGKRVGRLRATVVEAEADVPDSLFEPNFPDGTSVNDLGRGNQYIQGGLSRPARNEVLGRLAEYRSEFRPAPWWQSRWLLGLGVVALLIPGIFFWRRRFRWSR